MPLEPLLGAVFAAALTYATIRVADACRVGGDTAPGVQRFHTHWVTRLGSVPIALALAVWLTAGPAALAPERAGLWLLCLVPALAGGLAEDLSGRVGPWPRLALTCVGAALGWWLLGAQVLRVGVELIDVPLQALPWLSLLVTVLVVAGGAHAYNIIDGYNGLAGLYATGALLAIAHVAGTVGDAQLATIAAGAACATIGFLAWNFPRGRIFLGDGGAYLLGTLVGLLLARLVAANDGVSPMFAALLMAYPVWETLFSIYRKLLLRRQSPLCPDGLHLHMLLHKRLVRTSARALTPAQRIALNSATTLYALPLMLMAVVPAVAFWDDGAVLLGFFALFVAAYVSLYRALVRFRMPAALSLRARTATPRGAAKPATTAPDWQDDGLVSVVVPCFNAGAYLGRAVSSVLAQTHAALEVIVVDDGSTDDSWHVAQALARADPRVRALQLPGNRGAAHARNVGIAQARGRYLAFLDADDQWLPRKLECQLAALRGSGAGLVHCAVEVIDATGRRLGVRHVPRQVSAAQLLVHNVIAASTVVIDRARTGPVRMPPLRLRQDLATWHALLSRGVEALGLDERLAIYTRRHDSLSANKAAAAYANWRLYRVHLSLAWPTALTLFTRYALAAVTRA